MGIKGGFKRKMLETQCKHETRENDKGLIWLHPLDGAQPIGSTEPEPGVAEDSAPLTALTVPLSASHTYNILCKFP